MSFQQITIMGNIRSEPDMRYTPSGVPVTSFSIPVSRKWTGKDGTEQEKTVWFRISAWQKLAEFAGKHLSNGSAVLIVGEMEEPTTWQGKDGTWRAGLNVKAITIQFAPRSSDSPGTHSSELDSINVQDADGIPF